MIANDIEECHRKAAYFLVFQFGIWDTSSGVSTGCKATCLTADNIKAVSFYTRLKYALENMHGSTHTHTLRASSFLVLACSFNHTHRSFETACLFSRTIQSWRTFCCQNHLWLSKHEVICKFIKRHYSQISLCKVVIIHRAASQCSVQDAHKNARFISGMTHWLCITKRRWRCKNVKTICCCQTSSLILN